MLETEYGRDNPALWLTQLLEALVRNCRYLCSLGMHTQGMTVDEATQASSRRTPTWRSTPPDARPCAEPSTPAT